MADDIGPYGDNAIVNNILDGSATLESLGLTSNDIDIELKTLLKCLQRATTSDGNPIKDMDHGISLEDYTSLFKHTKESTSSSPSKIHMGHYIASCEHTKISQVHCTFMDLPFRYGFTLDRWLNSLHCMLLKKDKPYLTQLRIIQLIEADFNGALKILLSCRLMRHADTNGINSRQTHGGRQGHSTYDAMVISQLSTDITRLNKSNLLVMFNDADGCYDRIRPEPISLLVRRMSCPKQIAACHTRTLVHMVHKVLTAHGISLQSITNTP